jgi:hypothetical protein
MPSQQRVTTFYTTELIYYTNIGITRTLEESPLRKQRKQVARTTAEKAWHVDICTRSNQHETTIKRPQRDIISGERKTRSPFSGSASDSNKGLLTVLERLYETRQDVEVQRVDRRRRGRARVVKHLLRHP